MTVSNAFDPIELPANVSLLQERGLSRYRPRSNIIQPYHSRAASFPGMICSKRLILFVDRTQGRSEGAGIGPAINQNVLPGDVARPN